MLIVGVYVASAFDRPPLSKVVPLVVRQDGMRGTRANSTYSESCPLYVSKLQ